MHTGKSYKVSEFLIWTRRSIYAMALISLVPVVLYQVVGLKWLVIPWGVVFLLGTTVALTAGFKNTQTYNRTWEAQQVWTAISSTSRVLGALSRDFLDNPDHTRGIVYRHFAWLTALRYQMRVTRSWETLQTSAANAEYRKHYSVSEQETALQRELEKYVGRDDAASILASSNHATEALRVQSAALKRLLAEGAISTPYFIELQKILRELNDQQAKAERIKDYPYPRQYAIVNAIFVRILAVLLPVGMIGEFERLNSLAGGFMQGQMVWLVVPLSVLIAWMYISLDQVGESTSNPFEGGANDIPITEISRSLEADLRDMLGEVGVPAPAPRSGHIVT
ncbi:MAG: bestrophin family protein [Pseudoxanthomonas sp.]